MKKKIFLIIGIIGILLIGVGVVLNLVFNNASSKNKNTEETENKAPSSMSNPDSNYYTEDENGVLVNTSKKIKKAHTTGDLTAEDMVIAYDKKDEYLANYSFQLKNTGAVNYTNLEFSIVFIFADGLKRESPSIKLDSLAVGETTKIEKENFVSIVGAEDYEIKIISSN